MNNRIVFNTKPSHRVVDKFKRAFPMAKFYGRATLGGRSNSYLLPEDVYNERKEELKQYGSKARKQLFLVARNDNG